METQEISSRPQSQPVFDVTQTQDSSSHQEPQPVIDVVTETKEISSRPQPQPVFDVTQTQDSSSHQEPQPVIDVMKETQEISSRPQPQPVFDVTQTQESSSHQEPQPVIDVVTETKEISSRQELQPVIDVMKETQEISSSQEPIGETFSVNVFIGLSQRLHLLVWLAVHVRFKSLPDTVNECDWCLILPNRNALFVILLPSNSERILKISQHLLKLWARVGFLFFYSQGTNNMQHFKILVTTKIKKFTGRDVTEFEFKFNKFHCSFPNLSDSETPFCRTQMSFHVNVTSSMPSNEERLQCTV